jgi:hypothetical protein
MTENQSPDPDPAQTARTFLDRSLPERCTIHFGTREPHAWRFNHQLTHVTHLGTVLGYIPDFIANFPKPEAEYITPEEFAANLEAAYAAQAGPPHRATGFTPGPDYSLLYPGDPPMTPLAAYIPPGDQLMLVAYEYAFFAVWDLRPEAQGPDLKPVTWRLD